MKIAVGLVGFIFVILVIAAAIAIFASVLFRASNLPRPGGGVDAGQRSCPRPGCDQLNPRDATYCARCGVTLASPPDSSALPKV
jgi:uncharacterized paraquat-inducible protein A